MSWNTLYNKKNTQFKKEKNKNEKLQAEGKWFTPRPKEQGKLYADAKCNVQFLYEAKGGWFYSETKRHVMRNVGLWCRIFHRRRISAGSPVSTVNPFREFVQHCGSGHRSFTRTSHMSPTILILPSFFTSPPYSILLLLLEFQFPSR